MKFGEKLRTERKRKGLTQAELGSIVGVSKRTIVNYESGEIYPKGRKMYADLAAALDVDASYLISEDEEFICDAGETYGSRGRMQARRLVNQVSAMFAGGELDEDDKLAFIHQIQALYFEGKDNAKRFTPSKHKKDK